MNTRIFNELPRLLLWLGAMVDACNYSRGGRRIMSSRPGLGNVVRLHLQKITGLAMCSFYPPYPKSRTYARHAQPYTPGYNPQFKAIRSPRKPLSRSHFIHSFVFGSRDRNDEGKKSRLQTMHGSAHSYLGVPINAHWINKQVSAPTKESEGTGVTQCRWGAALALHCPLPNSLPPGLAPPYQGHYPTSTTVTTWGGYQVPTKK